MCACDMISSSELGLYFSTLRQTRYAPWQEVLGRRVARLAFPFRVAHRGQRDARSTPDLYSSPWQPTRPGRWSTRWTMRRVRRRAHTDADHRVRAIDALCAHWERDGVRILAYAGARRRRRRHGAVYTPQERASRRCYVCVCGTRRLDACEDVDTQCTHGRQDGHTADRRAPRRCRGAGSALSLIHI